MHLTFKATRYELSPQARDFAEKKISTLRKFERGGESSLAEIELEELAERGNDGARYRAEANLSFGGALYRAEARSATLEAAVEKVRHELARELRKAKGKEQGLGKRAGAALKNFLRSGR